MTGSQLITNVQDNFGERDRIGSRSFADAALDALNFAVIRISTHPKFPVQSLERRANGLLTTISNLVDFPTTDTDSNVIVVRTIRSLWASSVGSSNAFRILPISVRRKDNYYPEALTTGTTDRPRIYAKYKSWVEVYPYPDQSYTLYWRVIIKPDTIATDTEQPLGSLYDQVLIAGASSHLFLSLQEPGDYQAQEIVFLSLLRDAIRADSSVPDEIHVPMNRNSPSQGDYWLNPMIKKNP